MRLQNKVAIVTGGSRGIGLATVEAFLKEGATVILTASTLANADRAAANLRERFHGVPVYGISPDLTSLASVREAFEKVAAEFGRIDILVNNAGVSERTPFTAYTEELYDKVIDLNVKGVFTCSKAAADIMVEQGSGVIVNTSSMVSHDAQPSGFA